MNRFISKIKQRIFASQRASDSTQVSEDAVQTRKMAEFYRNEITSLPCLVFDIGANVGNRTKVFRDIGWSVVAVDPQKSCCAALAECFAGDSNVKIVNKAIGEQPGMAQMYISSADVLSSLSKEFIEKTSSSGRFQESWWDRQEEVEIVTLEQLISEHGVPKFIKIDVEGFEHKVLDGARKLLCSRLVRYIEFEFTTAKSDGDCLAEQVLCWFATSIKRPTKTIKRLAKTIKRPTNTIKRPTNTTKKPTNTIKKPTNTMKRPGVVLVRDHRISHYISGCCRARPILGRGRGTERA